jgi:hypothetical protein
VRPSCPLKAQCTTGKDRRVKRCEREAVLDAMQRRLDRKPEKMLVPRRTIEHVFDTLKHWMESAHVLMKTLHHVRTEMSLRVLTYNLKRVISMLGIEKTMKAMRMAGARALHWSPMSSYPSRKSPQRLVGVPVER